MNFFYFTLTTGILLGTTLFRGTCLSAGNYSEALATQPRVVGGRPALPGEIPYILSLQIYGRHFCGASLVRDPVAQIEFAVTAGHCVQSFEDTNDLILKAGSLSLTNEMGSNTTQVLAVRKIVMHPNYQHKPLVNDIAIIFMSDTFQETANVKPIALPNSGEITEKSNEKLLASGWGRTKERSDILQVVRLPVVENDMCAELYESFSGNSTVIFDSNICAGEVGHDTCQGDSGGPLATSSSDNPVLIGITSWGYGCARPNFPGVYTRVSKFIEWIHTTAAAHGDKN